MISNATKTQKARNYAFLLLKFRLRSENEIYQRLKKKKFDEHIIRDTISFLKEKGFVDDNIFAKSWVQSRLKKPLGLARIKQELRLKGIPREIIDREIKEIETQYREEESVFGIAQARFNKLKSLGPDIAKRRVYAYLLRRGFSPGAITEAINQFKDSY